MYYVIESEKSHARSIVSAMINVLPLDVLPNILHFLAAQDLQTCSIVNHSFHQDVHPLLFSHLVLCYRTWDKKCRFLLHDMNTNRCALISKLTIQLEMLPVYRSSQVPTELISLLVKISPQVRSLNIDGFKENEYEAYNDGTSWEYISPIFRDILCQHLMPPVQSLRIVNIGGLPVYHFSSGYAEYPPADYTTGDAERATLPDITSLTLDPFLTSDQREITSLSHFVKGAVGKLSSFTIFEPFRSYHSINLQFLQPFEEIRTYLHHLSLGFILYNFIVYGKRFSPQFNSTELLPLASFSQLQTVSISIRIPSTKQEWDYWFKWLTVSLEATDSTRIPTTFKALRLTVIPHLASSGNFSATPHPLNDLHNNFNFSIELTVPISLGNEMVEKTFTLLRSTLPSWDGHGKLKLWIDYTC
ncbi:hypothetical protein DL96DRAFT_1757185 [Flagelloscypha sp. PMI_526]|nr:hypothetical protein DL96DRAFT_1757185 [Flagelloscypha sp. PMI_526]